MNDMPMQAELAADAYRALFELCMDALPYEACGVLTGYCLVGDGVDSDPARGRQSAVILRVTGVHRVANVAANPEKQFAFDPDDWIQVLYRIQKNRQSLVGFFHSHPASMPVPSKADRDGFLVGAGGTSYWILSPDALRHELSIQPYWIHGRTFQPLMLAQISV